MLRLWSWTRGPHSVLLLLYDAYKGVVGSGFVYQESCSDGPFMAVDFRVRNMSTNFYAVGLDMLANYLFVFSYCQVLPQIKFILSNLVQTLVLDFKLKSNDQF